MNQARLPWRRGGLTVVLAVVDGSRRALGRGLWICAALHLQCSISKPNGSGNLTLQPLGGRNAGGRAAPHGPTGAAAGVLNRQLIQDMLPR